MTARLKALLCAALSGLGKMLVALLCASSVLAQPAPAPRPDEAQLQANLRAAEQRDGPDAAALVSPLLALQQLYMSTGSPERALEMARRALQIAEHRLGAEHPDVARLTNNLGEVAREGGALADAVVIHARSLALHEKRYGPAHTEVAMVANNYALALQQAGRYGEALPLLERSLEIRERAQPRDEMGIANSLNSLGEFHRMTGAPAQSAAYYSRSLAIIERHVGAEHWLTALLLGNLATARLQSGQLDQALPMAQRSLALREKNFTAPHPQIAMGLNLLGETYRALGDDAKTAELLQRGLAMQEQVLGPWHFEVSMALNNLGGWNATHGRTAEALALYQRSRDIVERQLGPDHALVATSLSNTGALLLETGRADEAIALHRRSLAIRELRLGPDAPETAFSLHNLAIALAANGDRDGALELLHRVVTVAHDNPASRDVRTAAQHHLSRLYADAGQYDLAILWGKESINTQQTLRIEVEGLEQGLRSSYLETRRSRYDHLADLLISQGRIQEAQDVLQMLKENELHEDLVRSATTDPRDSRIALTGLERDQFARYYALRDNQAALAAERQSLEARARSGPLPAPDAARLRQIRDDLQAVAQNAMRAFLATLGRDLAAQAPAGRASTPVDLEASRLRNILDVLSRDEPQARTVGIQYLVTDQRLSIVLSLPGSPPIAHQQAVGRKQLYDRIAVVLQQLKSPKVDPQLLRLALGQLHDWLIAPIASDLKRYGAATLMLSLDDQLRLVPFAALIGKDQRYLVQDYALSLYNEAARLSLQRPADRRWRIAAMGLSEAVDDLQPLRAVPDELKAIISGRKITGDAFLNGAFDRNRFNVALQTTPDGPPRYNVLHVASHFVLRPGVPAQSRLYLGDKSRLTLADIIQDDLRFGNFELVTFSACDTARGGGRDASGREMESLGANAQQRGARAVMATLWQVADQSTSSFMQAFYTATTEVDLNKAAALRSVQLAMIEGKLRPASGPSWSEPFYWAPFVMMGNWR